MNISSIIQNSVNIKNASECLNKSIRLSLSGMGSGEKSLLIHNVNKKSIIVCRDFVTLSELKASLSSFGHRVGIINYGLNSPIFSYNQDNTSMLEFISNIFDFYLNNIDILLVLCETLLQRLPNKEFLNNYLTFKKSNDYNFQNIEYTLTKIGYKRNEYATKKGEFSVRGDIVDIFPINANNPIRLDFFGDNLEKISRFSLDSMKSYGELNEAIFYPATIFIFDENKNAIIENFNNEIKKIKINNDNYSKINDIKSYYLVNFENNSLPINNAFILPFFNFNDNLLSLFSDNLIYFDEPKKIFDDFNLIYNNNLDSINNLIRNGELLPIHSKFNCELKDILKINKYCLFDNYNNSFLKTEKTIHFRTIGTRKYVFDYKALCSDINIYLSSNYKVFLFCGSKTSLNSIGTFLLSNNVNYQLEYKNNNKAQVILLDDYLELSASFLESGIIFIGTNDLVKRTKTQSVTLKKSTKLYLPKIGEYVVHEVHGIGKCIDIKKLNLNGFEKDYFILEYKGGDVLYVPTEQTNLISAFMGSDKKPNLNKIGGLEFSKIKERVKQSVKQLAFDLSKLYAEREKLKGHRYEKGSYLMEEFENAFEYDLTYDQNEAVNDIKKDLYSSKIMDRLICGDVGYGKTEVALRAAYQVVLEGKQVAFLCPTTILSIQHYKTTVKRTKDFMCNVQVLNRFKTKQEQVQILKDLKDGKIDILIGTHRLLSNDVVFKDLGLLILDEEHRFGVADKEKIKNLKKDIDVLTLSATPIPRTLNMAMTGIRDISIIETPPKNRLPVQTYVLEESEVLIVDACNREISRQGQVLIVYNSVEKIYDFAKKIGELLPNARIGVAHGQMPEKILEDVILKLYNGEFDILVATTLIENGIDLPMANTLIVIDADRLGLSQLYQLKGRIGRSDRLAYAYFTYNPTKVLSQDAYKRLDAILEFTELGSGFKIAMRDLEIRGAGNVLGKEQHGHMEKVGYEMYCKLLEEAVSELKGKKKKEELPLKVDISCPAFLPDEYVKGDSERIKLYSQISEISSPMQLEELKKSTFEAFGQLPKELLNLFKIALIKNLCVKLEAKRIVCDAINTKIYLYKKEEIISPKCAETINKHKDICVLKFEDVPIIVLNLKSMSMQEKLDFVINFLVSATNN